MVALYWLFQIIHVQPTIHVPGTGLTAQKTYFAHWHKGKTDFSLNPVHSAQRARHTHREKHTHTHTHTHTQRRAFSICSLAFLSHTHTHTHTHTHAHPHTHTHTCACIHTYMCTHTHTPAHASLPAGNTHPTSHICPVCTSTTDFAALQRYFVQWDNKKHKTKSMSPTILPI